MQKRCGGVAKGNEGVTPVGDMIGRECECTGMDRTVDDAGVHESLGDIVRKRNETTRARVLGQQERIQRCNTIGVREKNPNVRE